MKSSLLIFYDFSTLTNGILLCFLTLVKDLYSYINTSLFIAGLSYKGLQYYHRISFSSISQLVPVVCEAIFQSLKKDYLEVTEH